MSVNQTAHNLFVHRNTLNNRLLRIKKLFELDPKNTEDLFQLFIDTFLFTIVKLYNHTKKYSLYLESIFCMI